MSDGFSIILLSDRAFDSSHAPMPSLLAVSAVHHHLIRKGFRGKVGLVVEAGDVWETHHFATLIGYGASGVNPYLAFDTISDHASGRTCSTRSFPTDKLHANYVKAVGNGLLKIFSKMGISTLQSYQGAQIFEALGISQEVIDRYFTGTVSRIGGLTLDDIARETPDEAQTGLPRRPGAQPAARSGRRIPVEAARRSTTCSTPQTIHLLQQSTTHQRLRDVQKLLPPGE